MYNKTPSLPSQEKTTVDTVTAMQQKITIGKPSEIIIHTKDRR